MSVLFLTLPLALLLGAFGLLACIRCIKTGQYDDLDTQGMRILQEDQRAAQAPSSASEVQPPSSSQH